MLQGYRRIMDIARIKNFYLDPVAQLSNSIEYFQEDRISFGRSIS